ncbi:sensor domain-containing diguanylate cyclase [Pseudomonas sp. GD03860]|uniref:sensor domain-containing diguanylate cyclase n=1 Tax=Pseudomonas TaxID=286 RepID=UPI0023645256|nr:MULTISPECIES: sensor domain-containing diguanylate cyclase [Pseudomonas]MDD2056631.1 sensor domain-containing diguanylate cyclase [Pseudomonas putida]MDH0638175.1 sensor domain-containing diguanylate cyclase [Pseudomonas sp. GD03860]
MKSPSQSSIGLRGLILTFVLIAVLFTLANCLLVAYSVQRDALIHSALEANRAYAFKVATSIDGFLRSVHERLTFSSQILGRDFSPQSLKAESYRLQAQDSELDTVLVVDAAGTVLQSRPDLLEVGSTVVAREMKFALQEQRPMVSHVYTAANGKLIVFVSQPIFNPSGQYLGLIGGSIQLEQHGVMHNLIGEHQLNGTFAFVADANRRLLYHPDQKRIGEALISSATVDAAIRGEQGQMQASNYQGVPMLAGYAQVADAKWAVVTQQPRDEALAPLSKLMRDMLVNIIPAGLIGLLLITLGALLISRPLRQLARYATDLSAAQAGTQLSTIRAWYAEAAAIRQALIASVQLLQQKIGTLSQAADSDPLTGLANRRAMNAALKRLDDAGHPYAVLALDIDHFKRVNDTHGHDVGDEALKHIARIIAGCSRAGDLTCRAGGEEFCLILPDATLDIAQEIAERIRSLIAVSVMEPIGTLTMSIGVACRGLETPNAPSILKRADERLYLAKQSGRNCVVSTSR